MPTEVNVLIRSMRQLVPNPETSAILTAMGVSYWAYDPVAEELCWQRTDPTSVRGYRLAKLSIHKALHFYIQRDRTRFLQVISNAVEHGLSQTTRVTCRNFLVATSLEFRLREMLRPSIFVIRSPRW